MSYSYDIKTGDSHVYYNATILNDKNYPIPCNFKEIRTDPVIKFGSNYHMSIIRFLIPNSSGSIFSWPDNGTPGVPDNTKFKVSLSYNSVDYIENLIYEQLSPPSSFPLATNLGVYQFHHLAKIINTGYLKCYQRLIGANASLHPFLLFPPYMVYNKDRSTFEFNTTPGYLNSSIDINAHNNTPITTAPPIVPAPPTYPLLSTVQIGMNYAIYSFFENFNVFFYGYTAPFPAAPNTPRDISTRFLIDRTGNNNVVLTPPMVNNWSAFISYSIHDFAYVNGISYRSLADTNLNNYPPDASGSWVPQVISGISQVGQFSNLMYFQKSLRQIRVNTSLIPTKTELVGSVNSTGSAGFNSGNYSNILTDFIPDVVTTSDDNIRGYIQYIPTAEYRMTDIQSNQEIRTIDMQIYSVDYKQVATELFLSPGESCSVKIMFRKI